MKIGLLHGWLLDGSGSNVYVRSLAEALAARGHEVHVICQEPRPERHKDAAFRVHVPPIDHALMPVYVPDTEYEGFTEVRAFAELVGDPRLGRYLADFAAGAGKICREHGIEALHANHVYPMPEVARRVKAELGIPYIVFPHGSAIEYAVKPRPEIAAAARRGIAESDCLVVGNEAVTRRIFGLFPQEVDAWKLKLDIVPVGVDCSLFEPVPRDRRAASVGRMEDEELPMGGRPPAMSKLLLEADLSTDKALLSALEASASAYRHKALDQDLMEKLRAVDWVKDRTVIYMGKLIAAKGVQDLFAALPAILDEHPGTTVFVAGEGPFREGLELLLRALSRGDRALLERLVRLGDRLEGGPERPLGNVEAYVRQVGIEDLLALGKRTRPIERVIFTGYLQHALLRHLLPCADLAVFPSLVAEAYPLVLLEAISAGVLPAGSYFEGLGEGLEEIGSHLGRDVMYRMRFEMKPEKRIASIAAGVSGLLAREPDWSGKCRKLAVGEYSWERVALFMEKVYGVLVQSP